MFSNDKNIETIGQLIETTKHYIGLQTKYAKLDVMVKIVRLLTAMIIAVILSVMFMLALIYLSFGAAYAIGTQVGNALGFCIVAAFYIRPLPMPVLQEKMDRTYTCKIPVCHTA